jgi:hypothetical protein
LTLKKTSSTILDRQNTLPEAQYHHANAAYSLLTLYLLAKAQELCSVPQRREANVDCASAWLGYAKDFECHRLNTKWVPNDSFIQQKTCW